MNFNLNPVTGDNPIFNEPRKRGGSRPKSPLRVQLEEIPVGNSVNITPIDEEGIKKVRSVVSSINKSRSNDGLRLITRVSSDGDTLAVAATQDKALNESTDDE